MLAILSPILVALCSGLAFLAYKHPKGYSKIANVLFEALFFAFALYLAWCFGFSSGYYGAAELKSYEEGIPLTIGYTSIILFTAYIYLVILKNLPQILSTDEKIAKDEEVTEDENT